MSERTVNLYCSREIFKIQHLANHLENEGIECQIIGATATVVLGLDPTQKTCIRVFQGDFVKAKAFAEKFLADE